METILARAIASALPLHSGDSESSRFLPAPIVNGVPKLLFTDEDVAAMFGMSVSTVRNRCNRKSRWHDPNFPVPRSTDGSGEGRKAAVRWHWADLCAYAADLPPVTSLNPPGKPTRYEKPSRYAARYSGTTDIKQFGTTGESGNKPFDL
jgi:hypothetical protein